MCSRISSFQGEGDAHRFSLGGILLVRATQQVVSSSSPYSPSQCHRASQLSVEEVFRLPRVVFLSQALSSFPSPQTVRDIVSGLRSSATRQYESCWRKFQGFHSVSSPPYLALSVCLETFPSLFNSRKVLSPSIAVILLLGRTLCASNRTLNCPTAESTSRVALSSSDANHHPICPVTAL